MALPLNSFRNNIGLHSIQPDLTVKLGPHTGVPHVYIFSELVVPRPFDWGLVFFLFLFFYFYFSFFFFFFYLFACFIYLFFFFIFLFLFLFFVPFSFFSFSFLKFNLFLFSPLLSPSLLSPPNQRKTSMLSDLCSKKEDQEKNILPQMSWLSFWREENLLFILGLGVLLLAILCFGVRGLLRFFFFFLDCFFFFFLDCFLCFFIF